MNEEYRSSLEDESGKEIPTETSESNKLKKRKPKLSGLRKLAASAVLGVSALGVVNTPEASGQQKPIARKVEQKESLAEKKRESINLFDKIYNLPEQDSENKDNDRLKKIQTANILIQRFALQRKLGYPEPKDGLLKISGTVTPEDLYDGLRALERHLDYFPSFREVAPSNPGMTALKSLMDTYFADPRFQNRK